MGTQRAAGLHLLHSPTMFDGVEWGELCDFAGDPGEMVDLWEEFRACDAKARMIERLAREENAHIDRVPMPTARA